MKRGLTCFLIIFMAVMPVFSAEFIPALDINGGITYPTILAPSGELDKKLGIDAALAASCMLNTDFAEWLWLIPTLTMNYTNTAQPLNVEDERFLFQQWLDIYFSGGFNFEFSDAWQVRLRGFYRKDYTVQSADENFGSGLYDYNDWGGYIENVNALTLGDTASELVIGCKYTDKRYPNYSSLISEVDLEELGYNTPDTEAKEKDYMDITAYISGETEWGKSGWYSMISFTFDYMPYYEQKIFDAIGQTTSAKRIDRYATFEINAPYYYPNNNSGFEISYTLTIRTTDQNYYDRLGDLDENNNVFVPDYYNYIKNQARAAFNYEFPNKLFTDYKPIVTIAYEHELVNYTSRRAKDIAGDYTEKLQGDSNSHISFDLRQNIMEHWNYYFNAKYSRYTSNMKWEAYASYNYNYLTLSVGTAVSF